MSLIDDMDDPKRERMGELDFCLYGKLSQFCGSAKVRRLQDGPRGDASAAIKAFVESTALLGK